jgi:hypothetical protein
MVTLVDTPILQLEGLLFVTAPQRIIAANRISPKGKLRKRKAKSPEKDSLQCLSKRSAMR